MKEYYVDWINEDQEQIEGRKPHNDIRSDGELTEAETAEEAVENVRQWILEQVSSWTDANGNYYEWCAEEKDTGDIIIWDIGGENKKLIAAYLDFKARERMVTMTYRIHEVETNWTYDDIYNTIGEAKAQIEEYIKDDNNEAEPRTSAVTYIVVDENGEDVTYAE